MKNDLETLRSLAANLTEEFKRVSEDYTLGKQCYWNISKSATWHFDSEFCETVQGFKLKVSNVSMSGLGTFIDKNVSPMSYVEPTRKANPCYNSLDVSASFCIKIQNFYVLPCEDCDCPQRS